jgi:hypothetical protein
MHSQTDSIRRSFGPVRSWIADVSGARGVGHGHLYGTPWTIADHDSGARPRGDRVQPMMAGNDVIRFAAAGVGEMKTRERCDVTLVAYLKEPENVVRAIGT